MCATISTSPDCASVATQVTSPSASNFGVKARPSSTSLVEPGAANADDWATSASRAKDRRLDHSLTACPGRAQRDPRPRDKNSTVDRLSVPALSPLGRDTQGL